MGYYAAGTVRDCTSMATVRIGTCSGGVIGLAIFANNAEVDNDKISNCFSYGIKPIGKESSSRGRIEYATVKQVYRVQNTDCTVILPEEVSNTDGLLTDSC